MTVIKKLEERVDELAGSSTHGPVLTTEERNMVSYFWFNLHFTREEAEEYRKGKERMEAIHAAAGSVYLNAEQNREYMSLSARSTQLMHDVVPKRQRANEAMYDRILPELAPRVLRYWKLKEKPLDELTDAEAVELSGLIEWFSKLQAEALEAAENQLTKTSG